ncbi:unnamed protein product [Rotaria sordida]|uniref:Uncharacterized protein n=1 Tax=Rotaria sordida TaxID=392033 RepID=A0A814XBP0_9BILA|nr:unnamed protein product [Rotaria sordida]CAF1491801.1 unnamed protein product [Rotaria sordida]
MASAQFQILSILCRTSRRVVNGALIEFAAMTILSPSALSRDVVSTYIGTSIEQFQKNTLDNFRPLYHFVSSLVEEQQFLSALGTNFYTRGVLGSNNFVTFSAIYPQQVDLTQSSFMSNETCQCNRTSDCVYPAGIYNQTRSIIPNEVFSLDVSPLFMIPGFQVGCLPQNALFQSTLECFYNQTCLDIVISLTGALRTVSPLNISNSYSQFSPTTTIAVLFDNLMIESWENSIHFATYFQTCAPKACSYSYVQRFVLIYMITTIVSVFGGIRVAVYIASPLFVKLILRLCCRRVQVIEADEGHESSRIISQQVIVRNPSLDQFEHLHDMYSSILSCPCRNSSIQRSTFISSEVQIHPFCTSHFVRDDRWLQYWTMKFLDGSIDPTPSFDFFDFRKNGFKFFNYVKILCDTVNISLANIVHSFQAKYFFSPQLITPLQLNETVQDWNASFRSQIYSLYPPKFYPMEESIRQSGSISRDIIEHSVVSNQINNTWILEYTTSYIGTNGPVPCDCMQAPYCIMPMLIYNECFYDEDCVQMLIDQRLCGNQNIYLPIDLDNITALDPNTLISFTPQDQLINLMFSSLANQLVYTPNYTLYYAECQPEICTYTIDQELHAVARINLVIGLIGGLAVLLRILVPSFIKIIHLFYSFCYQQTRGEKFFSSII